MATASDSSLLDDPSPWTQMAYVVLDEMVHRGNLIASYLHSELQQVELILSHLPPTVRTPSTQNAVRREHHRQVSTSSTLNPGISPDVYSHPPPESLSVQSFDWHEGFTTENLMTFADSLDLDGLDWLYASTTFTGENSGDWEQYEIHLEVHSQCSYFHQQT